MYLCCALAENYFSRIDCAASLKEHMECKCIFGISFRTTITCIYVTFATKADIISMARNGNQRQNVARRLFNEEIESEEQIENSTNVVKEDTEVFLKNCSEMAKERWNFDFENETPLEGDWEWTKIEDVNNLNKNNQKTNNRVKEKEG